MERYSGALRVIRYYCCLQKMWSWELRHELYPLGANHVWAVGLLQRVCMQSLIRV